MIKDSTLNDLCHVASHTYIACTFGVAATQLKKEVFLLQVMLQFSGHTIPRQICQTGLLQQTESVERFRALPVLTLISKWKQN